MNLPLPPVMLKAFSFVQANAAMISPERVVDYMSNSLALRADHARFFLCILAAYPIAFVYHHWISRLNSRTWRLLYTFITGLSLVFWLVGLDFIHSLITIVASWLVITYMRGRAAVATTFVITLTYLFWGYYLFSLDTEYVICWTMPQCVLTLRLIGLAFDVVDGRRKNLSADQKKTALTTPPTLLETLAYTYFYSGALAGPQFPMRRFLQHIDNTLVPKELQGQVPDCVQVGFNRFVLGVLHIVLFIVGSKWFYDAYILSDEYQTHSVWYRVAYLSVWGKVYVYRYSACWLISEGACTLSGLSYSGPSEEDLARLNHTFPASPSPADSTTASRKVSATETPASEKATAAPTTTTTPASTATLSPAVAAGAAAGKGPAGAKRTGSAITQADVSPKLHVLERESVWEACTNIYLLQYELCTTGQGMIESFNVCTNKWAAQYVYKRLRFLGSRFLSHVTVLFFLAVWHGFYLGYYVSFAVEFIVIMAERETVALVESVPALSRWYSREWVKTALWPIRKVLFMLLWGFAFSPLVILHTPDWWKVWNQTYFVGGFHFLVIPLAITLRLLLGKKQKKKTA